MIGLIAAGWVLLFILFVVWACRPMPRHPPMDKPNWTGSKPAGTTQLAPKTRPATEEK